MAVYPGVREKGVGAGWDELERYGTGERAGSGGGCERVRRRARAVVGVGWCWVVAGQETEGAVGGLAALGLPAG